MEIDHHMDGHCLEYSFISFRFRCLFFSAYFNTSLHLASFFYKTKRHIKINEMPLHVKMFVFWGVKHHFQQYFSHIAVISFTGEGTTDLWQVTVQPCHMQWELNAPFFVL